MSLNTLLLMISFCYNSELVTEFVIYLYKLYIDDIRAKPPNSDFTENEILVSKDRVILILSFGANISFSLKFELGGFARMWSIYVFLHQAENNFIDFLL